MLYFAYGSNLSKTQMDKRCPGALQVSRAELPDHRLAFVGYSAKRKGAIATVIPSTGSVVYGALYEITADHKVTLDCCEGVKSGSYREEYKEINGQQALVYISNSKNEGEPSTDYLNVIRQGYTDWKLPLELLEGIKTND